MKKNLSLDTFEVLSRTDLQNVSGGGRIRTEAWCLYFCEISPDGGIVCGPPGQCNCDSGQCMLG